ncbi:rRNA-processing protein fcf2-like [Nymphaea colorata]|nr:rRNA-processing protein fcf2-like [Nymphaea colorata]
MPEDKQKIGLLWKPQLPALSSSLKEGNHEMGSTSSLWMPQNKLIDGLFVPPKDPKKINKLQRKQLKDTTGKKWFEMSAPNITSELKKDLEILKLRSVIDPKRHYKKSDSKTLPKYFQVGTVVEPVSEYFSSRLTRRQRKATLTDELLSDRGFHQYRKRKVSEIEDERRAASGVSKWREKKKKHKSRKPTH